MFRGLFRRRVLAGTYLAAAIAVAVFIVPPRWLDDYPGIRVALAVFVVLCLFGAAYEWWWRGEHVAQDPDSNSLAAPPSHTLLLAESESVVRSSFWHIDQMNATGPATGFRAFLLATRRFNPQVTITAAEAALPFTFRRHQIELSIGGQVCGPRWSCRTRPSKAVYR